MLLTTAFLLGLASTFHCVGMCGPVSLALPLNRNSSVNILLGLLQYHLGRIATYTAMGLLLGAAGAQLQMFQLLQWLSIAMGAVMIALAWKRHWIHRLSFSNSHFIQTIIRGMGKLITSDNPGKLFGLGMLNGLLPCGMVYVGLGNALLSGSVIGTGAAMAVFGLGTFPAMLAIGFLARQFTPAVRRRIDRFFPILLTLTGLLLIVRGANLGIPYLSPAITEQAIVHKENTAGMPQTVVVECHN